MTKKAHTQVQGELDLDEAEETLKQGLLRLYYVQNKLRAQGAAQVPSLSVELTRIERRAEELVSLWGALRKERALRAAERTLAESSEGREAAGLMLERLRQELEQRAAERTLQRELEGV